MNSLPPLDGGVWGLYKLAVPWESRVERIRIEEV